MIGMCLCCGLLMPEGYEVCPYCRERHVKLYDEKQFEGSEIHE